MFIWGKVKCCISGKTRSCWVLYIKGKPIKTKKLAKIKWNYQIQQNRWTFEARRKCYVFVPCFAGQQTDRQSAKPDVSQSELQSVEECQHHRTASLVSLSETAGPQWKRHPVARTGSLFDVGTQVSRFFSFTSSTNEIGQNGCLSISISKDDSNSVDWWAPLSSCN